MVGVFSLTSSPWLQSITTVVGECGAWWGTYFVSSQNCLYFSNSHWCISVLEVFPLPLPRWMGQGGRWGGQQVCNVTALPPCQQWLSTPLCCLGFSGWGFFVLGFFFFWLGSVSTGEARGGSLQFCS